MGAVIVHDMLGNPVQSILDVQPVEADIAAPILNITSFSTNSSVASPVLLTPVQVAGDMLTTVNLTGAHGVGFNAQLPSVASLQAAYPYLLTLGAQVVLTIGNIGTGQIATITQSAGGWTLTGTMTLANNTWREVVLTITGPGSATCVSPGYTGPIA
jgi:hypothetical protein